VLVSLLVAPPALAGQDIWVKVHNETPANVSLLAAVGSNCWEGQGLNHQPGDSFVAPKAEFTYTSEKKTGRGCGGDAHQNVQFQVQDPGGKWILPPGSPPAYRLFWQDGSGENYGINLYDGLGTWVPREDGKGLFCWHSEIKNANYAEIWAYSDRHCNVAVPETIQHSSPKPPPPSLPAPLARAAADEAPSGGESEKEKKEKEEEEKKKEEAEYPGVINVLSAVGVACPWYVYPKETQRCTELDPGNAEKWSIANLSAKVNSFKIKTSAAAKNEKVAVAAAQTSIPPGGGSGQLSVSESVGLSESNTVTTQRGGKIGAKLGFKQSAKAKIPFFGEGGVEFSQEVSGEYNWGRTEASTVSQTKQKTVSISNTAQPGFTTRLEVFTARRNANYIYEADLEFGDPDGKPQNVTTPANVALGQSPATRQPCLGYVVGSKEVRNSLVYIGEALLRAGYRPDDSSLPPEKRAFLESVPFYQGGAKPCAGFPAGYSSSAKFKGTGVGTYANLGYDLSGNPVTKMVGCVYVEPYKPKGPTSPRGRALVSRERARLRTLTQATAQEAPCEEVPVKDGKMEVESPGVLVDDSDIGGGGTGLQGPLSTGTAGSDRITGPRRGGTVKTGGGAFDLVETGSGDTRVLATARENIVEAKGGNDELSGGHGMSYLYGGGGADTLTETDGAAAMYGEGGGDSFEGTDMKGVMFGGGGDDKMVGRGDLSHLAMSGGAGGNVYVLKGRGTPSIVQMPGPGTSTVLTTGSLTVPPNIDVARAIGPGRVTLRGGEASKLVAGAGGGTLVSGPGPTRLRGRGGADTIVFDALNDDTATGGGGADRYVFSGSPETGQRPAGLREPAQRSAPLVTDFEPMRGDRLVMRSSVFGPEVLELRRHFSVVAAARPRPRGAHPTLLLDTRSGVVSFDRDGSGPLSDQVVVELPHRRSLERRWFEFRR
jgi:hypothetical protein